MKIKKIKLISKIDRQYAWRDFAALLNHYLVERESACRLKRADKQKRKKLYSTMYEEVFARVPDHSSSECCKRSA